MSFLTSPERMSKPKILGNAIVRIAISEKSSTAPRLDDEPITIKTKNIRNDISF